MSKIIAIANQKGGVGKTTTTHNLGVALAQQNQKVLLIDLDSQASLTIALGFEYMDFEKMTDSIVTVIKNGSEALDQAIYKISDNLHLIPSDITLAGMEMEMQSRPLRELILHRALKPIVKEYDYILIDCPPQLSILTINGLSAADYAIIPVKTDFLAYRGLSMLKETIQDISNLLSPRLEIAGVIATMYEKSIKSDQEMLKILEENYKVLGVVKKGAIAKKGLTQGQAAVQLDAKHELSEAYIELANKIIHLNK